MVEIKFNYEIACKCILDTFKIDKEQYKAIVQSSMAASLIESQKKEFLSRFETKPDNYETQLEIYGALLDDVCVRLDRGIKRMESEKEQAETISNGLQNMIRLIYTIGGISFITIKSPADNLHNIIERMQGTRNYELGDPIFALYMSEKVPEKPNSETLEKAMDGYLTVLKSKDEFEKNGMRTQLLGNLETLV